jgi:hypothetical protein
MRYLRLVTPLLLLLIANASFAQGITLPPSGDNQRSTVAQHIGPVVVTIDYSSPRVVRTDQGDRRGKIWGKLVPYGLADLGFGTCGKECPWRAGANENTTFTVTNDVKIEGQPLPAGTYGLHMIPQAEPQDWTLIFSKDSTSWGSFFYDPAHDALRVNVKPAKSEYHEFLTYEFTDREPAKATVALKWEELQVPFTVSVDDVNSLYLAQIRKELKGSKGFSYENVAAAAQFALRAKDNADALQWAQYAVNSPIGRENFATLAVLAAAQEANGQTAEAEKTREKALNHPTATAQDIHIYGRQLFNAGKKDAAVKVWQANAKKYGTVWPTNVSLARAYSATGDYKKALDYARAALAQAPDEANKKSLQAAIEKLQKDQDIN